MLAKLGVLAGGSDDGSDGSDGFDSDDDDTLFVGRAAPRPSPRPAPAATPAPPARREGVCVHVSARLKRRAGGRRPPRSARRSGCAR